jgi:hypothetical protein
MVWIVVGGFAAVVVVAAWAFRRGGVSRSGTDLGDISTSWLNQHRAHDRDTDPNR